MGNWKHDLAGLVSVLLGVVACAGVAQASAALTATGAGCGNCGKSVDNDFDHVSGAGGEVFSTDLAVDYYWNDDRRQVFVSGWQLRGRATKLGRATDWHVTSHDKGTKSCFPSFASGKDHVYRGSGCSVMERVTLASKGAPDKTFYMRAYVYSDGKVRARNSACLGGGCGAGPPPWR